MKINIKKISGLTLILLSFAILLVTAFVYEDQENTVTQTIEEIASITLDAGTLTIEEGETKVSTVDQILDVTTGKANVYLHFDTDLDGQSGNYSAYQIEVVIDTLPGGSTALWDVGDTIATLTMAIPDTITGADLDAAGLWVFDFRVTSTAGEVTADTPTVVTITVSAESTS